MAAGNMFFWGSGEHGQHGHGHTEMVSAREAAQTCHLLKITHDEGGVKAVACGSSHTIMVTNANRIYAWGNGQNGQTGTGDHNTNLEPTLIQLPYGDQDKLNIAGVACGGRHTFVWLANGLIFSFGNNFFAQLGYDFQKINYKENQPKPYLLRTLVHRPVQQVACGEKHTLILFKSGNVATVGNNSYGQLGCGNRLEIVVPKKIENFERIRKVSCGSFHNIVIDDFGEVWIWGFGPACGKKTGDVLEPQKVDLHPHTIVRVDGGYEHSVALTANGNLYTWGSGRSGELGHGPGIHFLAKPKHLRHSELKGKTISVAAVEGYTAAITESGQLYMWGKNSHVIDKDKPQNFKVWLPQLQDLGDVAVSEVITGSWHAAALYGAPDWKKLDSSSDMEDDSSETNSSTIPPSSMDMHGIQREKTTLTIAEFYADTPDSRIHDPEDQDSITTCSGVTNEVEYVENCPVIERSTFMEDKAQIDYVKLHQNRNFTKKTTDLSTIYSASKISESSRWEKEITVLQTEDTISTASQKEQGAKHLKNEQKLTLNEADSSEVKVKDTGVLYTRGYSSAISQSRPKIIKNQSSPQNVIETPPKKLTLSKTLFNPSNVNVHRTSVKQIEILPLNMSPTNVKSNRVSPRHVSIHNMYKPEVLTSDGDTEFEEVDIWKIKNTLGSISSTNLSYGSASNGADAKLPSANRGKVNGLRVGRRPRTDLTSVKTKTFLFSPGGQGVTEPFTNLPVDQRLFYSPVPALSHKQSAAMKQKGSFSAPYVALNRGFTTLGTDSFKKWTRKQPEQASRFARNPSRFSSTVQLSGSRNMLRQVSGVGTSAFEQN